VHGKKVGRIATLGNVFSRGNDYSRPRVSLRGKASLFRKASPSSRLNARKYPKNRNCAFYSRCNLSSKYARNNRKL